MILRRAPMAGFGCVFFTWLLHANTSLWYRSVETDPVFTSNDYQMRLAYTFNVGSMSLIGFIVSGLLHFRYSIFPTLALIPFIPRTGYGLLGLRQYPQGELESYFMPDVYHPDNLVSTALVPTGTVNTRVFGKLEEIPLDDIRNQRGLREVIESQNRLKEMIAQRKRSSYDTQMQLYREHQAVLEQFRQVRNERLREYQRSREQ